MSRVKAPGKWIEGLSPEQRIDKAALAVLELRLTAVELMLQPASARSDEDEEYIHQLRVATRRADAALLVFAQLIKPRRLEKTRRRLRKLRQAAGDARTCDVHLSILAGDRESTGTNAEQAVLDEIINWTAKQRRRVQKQVTQAAERFPVEALRGKRKRLIEGIDSGRRPANNGTPKARTFGDVAGSTLPELIDTVTRAAEADLHDPVHLHELRLCSKRLRYALELFACCCGEHFKQTYSAVQQVQGSLGDINDTHEIVARIEEFGAERRSRIEREADWPDAYEALLTHYRDRLAEQIAAFHEQWEREGRRAVLDGLAALEITGCPPPPVGATT